MKKILALLAVAAILPVSCIKGVHPVEEPEDIDEPEVKTGLGIKIDGQFLDWATLKPEQVSVAKNNPNSHWDGVSEIRCCADENFVYYYIKYNKSVVEELLEYENETLPIRLNINTDGEFESGYKNYSLDGYDFIVEGGLAENKQWTEYTGTLHQRLDDWKVLIPSTGHLVTGKGAGNEYEILFSRELFNNAVPADQKMGDVFYTGIRFYYMVWNPDKGKDDWTELSNLPNASADEGEGNCWGHLMQVTTVK